MVRGLTASITMADRITMSALSVSAEDSHTRRSIFSDEEAFQYAAQSGESSSPDPVLNIVINCM